MSVPILTLKNNISLSPINSWVGLAVEFYYKVNPDNVLLFEGK